MIQQPTHERSPALASDHPRGRATRETLKSVAQRLFAERGVAAVSVRDIVEEAGFRNVASLNYHFGGKQSLVQELVLDGAREAERWRQTQLDRLTTPRDASVDELIRILAWPLLSADPVEVASDTHMRFLNHVISVNRPLFLATVGPEYNRAYQRCLSLLRERIGLPRALMDERFILVDIYLRGAFATREAEIARHPKNNRWNSPEMVRDLLHTAQALLTAPAPTDAA